MVQPQWKIFYGDGSTFDSRQGEPSDAPPWDVQVIVQPHIDSGRYIICLYDYYIYRDDRWFGVDAAGVVDYLLHIGHVTIHRDGLKRVKGTYLDQFDFILHMADSGLVKIGRMLKKEEFSAIHRLAEADPDFPKRTAYRSEERHG